MKKRIYFILADENLFHPFYLAGVIFQLDKENYKIVGISIAKETHRAGFSFFLKLQYNLWGPTGFALLGFISFGLMILKKLKLKKIQTIKSIAQDFKIPLYEAINVNSSDHISYLKKKNIDIIVSSNGQIFKKDILALPKVACINRHTALLPHYGGVLPVFWAMLNNEKRFGVSIHYMKPRIDEGDILSQTLISMNKENSLFYNYLCGFQGSIPTTITGINNAVTHTVVKKFDKSKSSYFSFPQNKDYQKFHKKNKSITFGDLSELKKIRKAIFSLQPRSTR